MSVILCHLSGALKANGQTTDASKKDYETELQKWFGNSRDRGLRFRWQEENSPRDGQHREYSVFRALTFRQHEYCIRCCCQ